MNLIDYFVDPVLRGPTLGALFQALTTSLIGVLVFLRKETLLGESLSHATYPGLILGLLFSSLFLGNSSSEMIIALLFAAASAFIALKCLHVLTHKFQVRNDTALALILSSFFGLGILLVSALQHSFGPLYKKGEALLLGQTATMQDEHIYFYVLLFVVTVAFIYFLKKEIQTVIFDRSFSVVLGLPVKWIERAFQLFFLVAIVAGIRSTGVVLVSSLLIAPPLVGSLLSKKMIPCCLIAAFIGGLSALLGTVFSTEMSRHLTEIFRQRIVMPTGPSIALFLSVFAFIALFFAPQKGFVARYSRIIHHRWKRLEENLLKFLWRQEHNGVKKSEMHALFPLPFPLLNVALFSLKRNGFMVSNPEGEWTLTRNGVKKASRVVRLHRLWELYLVDVLGKGKEEVHMTAEEMEHILTDELEEHLLSLLEHPTLDPHNQPIPK